VCGYWGRLLSSPLLSREARKGQQAPEITTARSARTGWDGTETEALVAASTGCCGSSSSSLFLSLLNYISLKACKSFEQSTTKGDVNLVPRTQELFLGSSDHGSWVFFSSENDLLAGCLVLIGSLVCSRRASSQSRCRELGLTVEELL
jgi:hypothetical protein